MYILKEYHYVMPEDGVFQLEDVDVILCQEREHAVRYICNIEGGNNKEWDRIWDQMRITDTYEQPEGYRKYVIEEQNV